MAREFFGIDTDQRDIREGIIAKLESWKRPEVMLDISSEQIEKMGYGFLNSDEEWREAVTEELDNWQLILHQVERLSPERDETKAMRLVDLYASGKRVLAFSENIISLHYFLTVLQKHPVSIASKNGLPLVSDAVLRNQMQRICLDWTPRRRSPHRSFFNRFSEGVNLQSASTVFHLDTPTTVTVAEQRCGRVDRSTLYIQTLSSTGRKTSVYWNP